MIGKNQISRLHIEQLYDIFTRGQFEFTSSSDLQMVLFLGLTCSGKSTIINQLFNIGIKISKVDEEKSIKKSQEKAVFLEIEADVTILRTELPRCYKFPECNFFLCDTPGWEEIRQNSLINQILLEYYIRRAKQLRVIVIVINIKDLRGSKGGRFKLLFEEIGASFTFEQIRNRIVFIFSHLDNGMELSHVFEELCQIQKQYKQDQKKEHFLTYMKLFELIFQKNSYLQTNNFEKFKSNNLVFSMKDLEKSNRFKESFLKIVTRKRQSSSQINLKLSNSRIKFNNFLNRDLILKQKTLQKCLNQFSRYSTQLRLKYNIWDKVGLLQANQREKIMFLNQIGLANRQDSLKELQYINKQLKELNDDDLIQLHHQKIKVADLKGQKELKFNINLGCQLVSIQKRGIECGYFCDEFIDLQHGRYYGTFKITNQKKNQMIQLILLTNRSLLQKIKIEFYEEKKKRIQKRIQIQMILMKKEFEDFRRVSIEVKQTKNQNKFLEYYEKNKITRKEFLQSLPTRIQIEFYLKELLIFNNLNIYNSGLVSQNALKNFYKINYFLPEGGCQTKNCCFNYHLIEIPVFLTCKHVIQEFCFELKKFNKNQIYCGFCKTIVKIDEGLDQQMLRTLRSEYQSNYVKYFKLDCY